MRIFIDDTIFEKQRLGGISRYFCELIIELSKIPEVEVVLYVGRSSNAYLHSLEGLASVRLVRFRNRLRFPKRIFAALSSLRQKICFAHHCLGADLIIYHPSYYSLDAFISKRANATVITVHDLIYETRNDHVRPSKIKTRRSIQNRAERILTVSNSTAKDLAVFNPAVASKIDITELAAAAPEGTPQPSVSFPEKFFLFVGLRKDYKQGALALQSFHDLRNSSTCDLKMLFVGGGSLTKHELSLIDTLGLANHVSQINLSDADLHYAYTTATALIFPSEYEGFGLPVLEAIHHACPVIAQSISSIPSVGGEWPVYFDQADTGSLTRAMAQVIKEGRETIAKDRANARTQQINRFSWQKTAAKTFEAYQKALQ